MRPITDSKSPKSSDESWLREGLGRLRQRPPSAITLVPEGKSNHPWPELSCIEVRVAGDE